MYTFKFFNIAEELNKTKSNLSFWLNDLRGNDIMPFKGGHKETCLLRGRRLQAA